MSTTSTQQTYPGRASWRTAVQNVLSVVLVLGIVAPLVAAILRDELGEYLPDAWLAWVVAASAVLAAVAAALARIMAIPAVDAWLRHLGLSSTPTAPAIDTSATDFTFHEVVRVYAPAHRRHLQVGEIASVHPPSGTDIQTSYEVRFPDGDVGRFTAAELLHQA
ncbi:hypothetical protein [Cellulosimicrobium sp. TH-20]|uniref:hypothetical protein n=1 Tax=Cellulosimicrobium sp. TH-20 TaxID=1980001 RepID=UPI001583C24F